MKKLFIILALFLTAAAAKAQILGSDRVPQLFGGGFYQFKGHLQVDQSILFNTSDTNFVPLRPALIYRTADSALYYYNKSKWNKVLITGKALTTESDPSVSAVIKNATVADTTRWGKIFVDSIRRKGSTDSIFYYANGVETFAFKDNNPVITGKVDSVRKKNGTDSVFFYANGTGTFAFKDSAGGGSVGEVATMTNQGTGSGVFQQKVGTEFRLRSLRSPDANLTVTQNFNDIQLTVKPFLDSIRRRADSVFFYKNNTETFAYKDSSTPAISGEANTASNVGSGTGVWKEKSGVDLRFKSLSSLSPILTITGGTNDIQFDITSSVVLVTESQLNGVMTPSTSVRYYMTDLGKEGYWRYVPSDSSVENGGTIIASSNLHRFHRIYDYAVDPRWFGATADGTSTTSPGTDDAAAINAALAAAKETDLVWLRGGKGYRLSSSVNVNNTRPLKVDATVYVDVGITGFVVEGFRQVFDAGSAYILGRNTGAADSAAYAAYTGIGVYAKNCDKCIIETNNVRNFRVGVRLAGESVTTPKGTQYTYLSFNQIRDNYIQIELTTIGTTDGVPPTDRGNWCNGNVIFGKGGELGGGLVAGAGGTFGIKIGRQTGFSDSAIDSDQDDPFNGNFFYNVSPEGVLWGIYAQQAENNEFSGRIEGGAVGVNKEFFLQESTDNGGSAYNNALRFPAIIEEYFYPGGYGVNTNVPYGLIADAVNGTKAGSITLPGPSGSRFFNISAWESTSALASTDFPSLVLHGQTGVNDYRYLGRIIRPSISLDARIPLELKDTTLAVDYTVNNYTDRVYMNAAVTRTVTLPSPVSWRHREIAITNIGTATVNIGGTLNSTTTTSLAPGESGIFSDRNGTDWVDITKKIGGGGGGGITGFAAPGAGDANGGTVSGSNAILHYATNSTPGMVKLQQAFDSLLTRTIDIKGTGFNAYTLVGRQNGFSVDDVNGTANPTSSTLTNYNWGSGGSTRNIYFSFGKTGVTSMGFGNNGRDLIVGTEKNINGIIFRNTIGFASADLDSVNFTGTNLMKIFPSGNVLIKAAASGVAYADPGVKLEVDGQARFNGTVLLRAGTTGAGTAPLKFNSASDTTSVLEVGALEAKGDFLYWSAITSAVRRPIATSANTMTFTNKTWQGSAIGINYGGTGATTATAALNNLLPSQSGNAGEFLQTDGAGNVSWQPGAGGGSNWVNTGSDLYRNSKVSIGTSTAPTARLMLGVGGTGGTTNSAPLKFIGSNGLQTVSEHGAVQYDSTNLYIDVSKPTLQRQTIVTNSNTVILTNKTWNGNAIGTSYINGTAPDDDYTLGTTGVINGAQWVRNEGGFKVYNAITTQSAAETIATLALPQNKVMEVEVILMGKNNSNTNIWKERRLLTYSTTSGSSTLKQNTLVSGYTSDFTPANVSFSAGGSLTLTISVSSVTTEQVNWTCYIKIRENFVTE
jgi:hypothetical protein